MVSYYLCGLDWQCCFSIDFTSHSSFEWCSFHSLVDWNASIKVVVTLSIEFSKRVCWRLWLSSCAFSRSLCIVACVVSRVWYCFIANGIPFQTNTRNAKTKSPPIIPFSEKTIWNAVKNGSIIVLVTIISFVNYSIFPLKVESKYQFTLWYYRSLGLLILMS